MARAYSSVVSAAVAATKSHHTIYHPATAVVRPEVYDLLVSSSAAPADVSLQWYILRTTAAPGTPVAVTPTPINGLDPATGILGSKQATAEPTPGAALMYFSTNQRVTWRWCAVPGGELVMTQTAAYGITLLCQAISSGTPVCETTLFWRE